MENYHNIGGNSNIESYEIGDDYISVWFKRASKPYMYSYSSAGESHVETMKELAKQGSGLNSYIMNNVKNDFER